MKSIFATALLASRGLANDEAAGPYAPEAPAGTYLLQSFQAGAPEMIPSSDEKYAGQEFTIGTKDNVAVGIEGDKALYFDNAGFKGLTTIVDPPIQGADGKDVVLQYEVRYTEDVGCGGAYLKFLDNDKLADAASLTNETPYVIMFGPDKCGSDTNKVHFILRYENPVSHEWSEHHFDSPPAIKTDKVTHLYTLVIHPDNTFKLKIDNVVEKTGSLLENMTPPIQPPAQIDDSADSKPESWVDEAKINDPAASKPENWDQPEKIDDPEAEMPEDWDAEEDGEWEAPTVANPEYKGEWKHPQIDNPDYIGEWAPAKIENPNYFDLSESRAPADLPAIGAVAAEVWTTFSGISMDNILIVDSESAASEFALLTFARKVEAEQKGNTDKERASRHAQRLKLLEDGSVLGQIQYQAGEFFEVVRANPIAAVMTFIALIVGAIFLCCKCCCGDDGLDDFEEAEEEKPAAPAKSTEEPTLKATAAEATADDTADLPNMDDDAKTSKTVGTPKAAKSKKNKKKNSKKKSKREVD